MTLSDLGEVLRVDKSTVSRYEDETLEIYTSAISVLRDLFGCTADYLLGFSSFRLPAVTEEQARFLDAYDALPPAIREAVDGLMAPYMATAEKKKAL